MDNQIFKVDPQNILRSVDIVFQVMVKAAYRYDGLFPAIAERQNGNLLLDFPLPPPIPGQRNSDRAPRGNNLQHDIALLAALDGMGKILKRDRYLMQQKNYLETFAKVCAPASPTGLLPWGEHAYWNLHLGVIGNSYILQYGEQPLDAGVPTHHQMRPLPLYQWEIIHRANPDVLPRMAAGIDWHWMDEERTQFNRHAPITQFIRGYQHKRMERISGKPVNKIKGSDFPGASGLYINNYSAALALCDDPDPAWKEALLRFEDSWWNRRLDSGLCPKSGGVDPLNWNGPSLGQTLDLGLRLMESSENLAKADPTLSGRLREHGLSYLDAIFQCDQPLLEEGKLCVSWNKDDSPEKSTQLWAGNRGNSSTAVLAVNLLNAAHYAGNDEGAAMIARVAELYKESRIPRDQIVRAGDMGAVIALTGELYRITGEPSWLEAALLHATDAMELFFDSPLPRVSLGRSHYEAQQGSSALVHAMARLVLLAEGKECMGGLERPTVM